jgi:hypothetical protein
MLQARSRTAEATDADWVIKAIFPALTRVGDTLALSDRAGTAMPQLPGPSTRTSFGLAASRMALRSACASPLTD